MSQTMTSERGQKTEAKTYKNVKLFITDANDSPAKQVSGVSVRAGRWRVTRPRRSP